RRAEVWWEGRYKKQIDFFFILRQKDTTRFSWASRGLKDFYRTLFVAGKLPPDWRSAHKKKGRCAAQREQAPSPQFKMGSSA
ncbi:hypothetical protein, partial [Pseudomonas sp. OA65]|uniref:hypothetical protein n=1 Tax=Pseudomonas sp. OA65 TaxID=2818431 RepID=UPI001AA00930